HLAVAGLVGVDLVPVRAYRPDLRRDLRLRGGQRDRVPSQQVTGGTAGIAVLLEELLAVLALVKPHARQPPGYDVPMERPRWMTFAASTCSAESTVIRTFIRRSLPLTGSTACSRAVPSASMLISMLTGEPA